MEANRTNLIRVHSSANKMEAPFLNTESFDKPRASQDTTNEFKLKTPKDKSQMIVT